MKKEIFEITQITLAMIIIILYGESSLGLTFVLQGHYDKVPEIILALCIGTVLLFVDYFFVTKYEKNLS